MKKSLSLLALLLATTHSAFASGCNYNTLGGRCTVEIVRNNRIEGTYKSFRVAGTCVKRLPIWNGIPQPFFYYCMPLSKPE